MRHYMVKAITKGIIFLYKLIFYPQIGHYVKNFTIYREHKHNKDEKFKHLYTTVIYHI